MAKYAKEQVNLMDEVAFPLEGLVAERDELKKKMEDIQNEYKKIKETKEKNEPICDAFYKNCEQQSDELRKENIVEFNSARKQLEDIYSKEVELEMQAKDINSKLSEVKNKIKDSIEKIMGLTKSNDSKQKDKIYVKGLEKNVDIIDTPDCDKKDDVDRIRTQIIETQSDICSTIFESYLRNVTKEIPKEEFPETKLLIETLDELKQVEEVMVDEEISKKIPFLDKQDKNIEIKQEVKIEEKPVLEQDNKVIDIDSFIRTQSPIVEPIVEEPIQEQKEEEIITIDLPCYLNPTAKIANSNSEKMQRITDNFSRLDKSILLEFKTRPKLSVSDNEIVQDKIEPDDLISKFLNPAA